ncbi:MAG: hypothetical protein Q7J15_01335 [Candidatus Desulfaltia sp.]|nr:hypothetical protein [Candidatus Desulfaltia sp.]
MRLKDYGRNQKKRKEHIHQNRLLLAGVDVSKAKHDAFSLPFPLTNKADSPIIFMLKDRSYQQGMNKRQTSLMEPMRRSLGGSLDCRIN